MPAPEGPARRFRAILGVTAKLIAIAFGAGLVLLGISMIVDVRGIFFSASSLIDSYLPFAKSASAEALGIPSAAGTDGVSPSAAGLLDSHLVLASAALGAIVVPILDALAQYIFGNF